MLRVFSSFDSDIGISLAKKDSAHYGKFCRGMQQGGERGA
ncbi:hypothetical protein BN439_2082 [Erwinia amylovora Ea644]|nr:hypothetical protein BN439_2082 [Erwinia amylovora Ea644]